jgi:hypothetical protein
MDITEARRWRDMRVRAWKVRALLSALSAGLDSLSSALLAAPFVMPTSTAAGSASHWPAELTYAPCAVELAKSSAPRVLQSQGRLDLRRKPGHMRQCVQQCMQAVKC